MSSDQTEQRPIPVQEDSVKQLAADNERLRNELAVAERKLEAISKGTTIVGKVATRISMGPGLAAAIERWEAAFVSSKSRVPWRRVPLGQTVDVVAAYLRRKALSGVFIALVASVPSLVTVFLVVQQNRKIDQQTFLTGAIQSAELQDQISELIASLAAAPSALCLDEKYIDPPSMERFLGPEYNEFKCWAGAQSGVGSIGAWAHLFNRVEGWAEIDPGRLNTASVRSNMWLWSPPPPKDLMVKSSSLSSAVRPYRMLQDDSTDDEPRLSRTPYSPERGTILRAFAAAKLSPMNMDLSRAWAPDVDLSTYFRGTNLANSFLECSVLTGLFHKASLARVKAAGADFSYSDLSLITSAAGADFSFAIFNRALLPDSVAMKGANIATADFDGALAPESAWYSNAGGSLGKTDPYDYKEIRGELRVEMRRRIDKSTTQRPQESQQSAFCNRRRNEGFSVR